MLLMQSISMELFEFCDAIDASMFFGICSAWFGNSQVERVQSGELGRRSAPDARGSWFCGAATFSSPGTLGGGGRRFGSGRAATSTPRLRPVGLGG